MLKLNNCRVIDLSIEVKATYEKESDRPYIITESLLQDGLYKHDVVTHSHVGTHVELPRHYYREGKTLENYPMDKFYGPGVLVDLKQEYITVEYMEELTKGKDLKDRIVLFRNSYSTTKQPILPVETSKWLVEKGVSIIGFEDGPGAINIGPTNEIGNQNHDILLKNDILLIEFIKGLDQIKKDEFLVFALPLKITKVDSIGIRLIAVEDI